MNLLVTLSDYSAADKGTFPLLHAKCVQFNILSRKIAGLCKQNVCACRYGWQMAYHHKMQNCNFWQPLNLFKECEKNPTPILKIQS